MWSQSVITAETGRLAMNVPTKVTAGYLTVVGIALVFALMKPSILVPWRSNSPFYDVYQFRTTVYRISFGSFIVVLMHWITATSLTASNALGRLGAAFPAYAKYAGGSVWLVYQAYVILSVANWMHKRALIKIVEVSLSTASNIQLFLLSNSTRNAPAVSTVWQARVLTFMYFIVYFNAIAIPIRACWYSELFTSVSSSIILGGTILLACITSGISLTKEVNKGLIVPAVFLVYATFLSFQILFVDSGNLHNISKSVTVGSNTGDVDQSGQGAIFERYSVQLQTYMYVSDAVMGLVFLISAYYSATNLDNGMFSHVRTTVGRLKHSVYNVLTKYVCRCLSKYDKEENKEESKAEERSGRASMSTEFTSTEGTENHIEDQDEARLLLDAENDTASSSNTRIITDITHPVSVGGVPAASEFENSSTLGINPTKEQMSAFYARMLLLVCYTPLLLTRWGAAEGTPFYSDSDLHLASSVLNGLGGSARVRGGVAHQYFVWVVLVAAWVAVWSLYIISLYSIYAVNSQYFHARRRLYLKDLRVDVVADLANESLRGVVDIV